MSARNVKLRRPRSQNLLSADAVIDAAGAGWMTVRFRLGLNQAEQLPVA
jgi:hypothetical protein